MRGWKMSVWGLAALVAVAAPALAARSASAATGSSSSRKPTTTKPKTNSKEKTKAGPAKLSGEYAKMADELKLTEAQRTRMAELVQTKEKALDAWDKQYGPKLSDLKKQQTAAESEGKDTLVSRLKAQVQALETARTKVEESGDARIMASLTPEQHTTWESTKLSKDVVTHFKGTRFTDDQMAIVNSLCKDAAQKLASEGAAASRDKALEQLYALVEARVIPAEPSNAKTGKGAKTKSSGEKKGGGRDKPSWVGTE